VAVQDVGSIHVVGRVGGTSARLRPAQFNLSWEDAPFSDALRLLRGSDFGVRGRLGLELAAHSEGAQWTFTAQVRASNVHRWDLPPHPSNPALNLLLAGDWWPEQGRIELAQAVLEAPQSALRAAGSVRWARPEGSPSAATRDLQLQLQSAGIHLADLLAWYRAFHPGAADDLTVEGLVGVDMQIAGWPPRVVRGVVATDGARLQRAGLSGPIRMGRAVARIRPDAVDLEPVILALPGQLDTLRVGGRARRSAQWQFQLDVAGKTERIQDLLETPAALGHPLPHSWELEGAAAIRMSWRGTMRPFLARPLGSLKLREAQWRLPIASRAVSLSDAQVEFRPDGWRITLKDAQAFGAHWSGRLRRSDPGRPWEFELAADQLDVAELDRWLNPQRNPSLLARMLSARSSQPAPQDWLAGLRGRGRLEVGKLLLAPLAVERLRGSIELDGRSVQLTDAQAGFYGGTVRGSMTASIGSQPIYRAGMRFDHVDLAQMAAVSPVLRGRFSGTAVGELSVTAQGLGRVSLLRSLEGRGTISARNAEDHGLDWIESFQAGTGRPGTTAFHTASAEFRLTGSKIEFDRLRLLNTTAELVGVGSVDFSRAMDLRVRALAPSPVASLAARAPNGLGSLAGRSFHLAGLLDTPEISPLAPERAVR
jgi:hypothetical protein